MKMETANEEMCEQVRDYPPLLLWEKHNTFLTSVSGMVGRCGGGESTRGKAEFLFETFSQQQDSAGIFPLFYLCVFAT